MSKINPYDALQVPRFTSDQRVLKQAHRRQAGKYHTDRPDKMAELQKKYPNKSPDEVIELANRLSQTVNDAWKLLGNPKSKLAYDAAARERANYDQSQKQTSSDFNSNSRAAKSTNTSKGGRYRRRNPHLDDIFSSIRGFNLHAEEQDVVYTKPINDLSATEVSTFADAVFDLDDVFDLTEKNKGYAQLEKILKKRKDLATHFVLHAMNAQLSGRSGLLDILLNSTPKVINAGYAVAFADAVFDLDHVFDLTKKDKGYEQLEKIIKKCPNLAGELLIASLEAQLSGYGGMLDQTIKVAPSVFTADNIQQFSTAINEMDPLFDGSQKRASQNSLSKIIKKRPDLKNAVQVEPTSNRHFSI